MDKHRICKICNKTFANGKAMGGHMRSHLAKLPIPPKPQPPAVPDTPPKSPSLSSSLSNPSTNKNHMQSYRSVNRELVCCLPKSDLVIHDRESETESPRNPTRRRSKRRRRFLEKEQLVPEPDSVSSVTETFSDEDVAMCLVMLSRDKWPKKEVEVGENEDEEEEESLFVTGTQTKSEAKYKCETCKKVFGSYQALGGHRASHTNKKIKIEPDEEEAEDGGSGSGGGRDVGVGVGVGVVGSGSGGGVDVGVEGSGSASGSGSDGDVGVGPVGVIDQKILFECPFCDKVFESGQALGGHKKVHYSYLAIAKNHAKSGDNLLDLNLPAPEDDGEDI